MKYKVIDKTTNKDITEEYSWVITPDGKLYFVEYGDFIGYSNAIYIVDAKHLMGENTSC